MKVYHGTSLEIKNPNLLHSRTDIDFGVGFYVTEDKKMAEKWATGKANSVVNSYELDSTNLHVVHLGLSKQWLDFVAYNRGFGNISFDTTNIDIIVGPTADDKMFQTISSYLSGFITADQAIRYLNVAGYSNQIVLKSEKALQKLSFLGSKRIYGLQKQELLNQIYLERRMSNKLLQDMIRETEKTKKEVSLQNEDSYEEER